MSSNPVDDLAKQLAAAAERQRLEAQAAEAAATPEARAALEKLARTLAEARSTPLAAPQPSNGTESAAENQKSPAENQKSR